MARNGFLRKKKRKRRSLDGLDDTAEGVGSSTPAPKRSSGGFSEGFDADMGETAGGYSSGAAEPLLARIPEPLGEESGAQMSAAEGEDGSSGQVSNDQGAAESASTGGEEDDSDLSDGIRSANNLRAGGNAARAAESAANAAKAAETAAEAAEVAEGVGAAVTTVGGVGAGCTPCMGCCGIVVLIIILIAVGFYANDKLGGAL